MRSSIRAGDSSSHAEDTRDPAFLSATHAYRPASIRSTSTSSVASSSAVAAALRANNRTPDGEVATASMMDRRQDGPSLHVPARPPQSRSPSHTAAVVAAARAATTRSTESTPSKQTPTKPQPADHSRPQSVISIPNDTSSIPSTTSLVSLFERKKAPEPVSTKNTSSVPIHSPKPQRPDGISQVFQMEVGPPGRLQGSQALQAERRQESLGVLGAQQKSREVSLQQRPGESKGGNTYRAVLSGTSRHEVRRQQGDQGNSLGDGTEVHDFANGDHQSDRDQDYPVGTSSEDVKSKPLPPTRRRQQENTPRQLEAPPRLPARTHTAPIDDRPRTRPVSSYESLSSSQPQSVSATYRQLYPNKRTPLTKDDELANAIVASSLASTRSTARREVPPPPPVTRRQSRGHFFHSRTPSPVKQGLLQTLRKQDSSESEDGSSHPFSKHHKKRLIRKHPNKHHEGDRKRWRDAVTEGERKRYEGVWAANKGLYINLLSTSQSRTRGDADTLNDQVCNVVVRDIWSRSRLPDYELEAVWDLVDTENIGQLSKEEFVVGMWLIDQRLKGRKLPVKVQPSVWTSVRSLQGIKIRNKQ